MHSKAKIAVQQIVVWPVGSCWRKVSCDFRGSEDLPPLCSRRTWGGIFGWVSRFSHREHGCRSGGRAHTGCVVPKSHLLSISSHLTLGVPISAEARINERIRVPEVRLVGPDGEQIGIVRIENARKIAYDADLDLVELAPNAKPPVCKIMDYGKYKYEQAQKARESRRNQQQTVVKEQKLRPKIDDHDYETKKGNVIRFLEKGSKVKVTIMFRGREQSRPELGYRLLDRLAEDVADYGIVETKPKQDGRNMTMVLGPLRRGKK